MLAGQVTTAPVASAAPADFQPIGSDVVGVGSSSLQNIMDFGANGDPSGDTGYNDAGNLWRLTTFDSTADSDLRGSWLDGAPYFIPSADPPPGSPWLDPTVVYQAMGYPVKRVDGGNAGINALLHDTAPTDSPIDFTTMTTQPTPAEASQAVANGWGGLQVFTLGTETLKVAAATGTNAPASLSVTQLSAIYSCSAGAETWNQVGGSGNDRIIPVLPPTSEDTAFLSDLGLTSVGSCVQLGQQDDASAITGLSGAPASPYSTTCTPNCAADAIEPFSSATYNLWAGLSGQTTFGTNPGFDFFTVPGTPYPGGTPIAPNPIKLLGGYSAVHNLNVVYPWNQQTSTTAWQFGGTLNWAQTLFCDVGGSVTPYFHTASGKVLIAEAGADPTTQSCLNAPLT
jgi:ABC-type phosphate transport system substrate-binding protein